MNIESTNGLPEQILDSGRWGPGTTWELVLSSRQLDPRLCTAVACVAIADIDSGEIVLTRHPYSDNPARRNKWEILAGHIDPLDPKQPKGPRETIMQALAREAVEESGFVVSRAVPFAYRQIRNRQPSNYPELSYMPYYWATTESELLEPTDPNQPAKRTFPIEVVRGFAASGEMNQAELLIIEHGLAAALRELRGITGSS